MERYASVHMHYDVLRIIDHDGQLLHQIVGPDNLFIENPQKLIQAYLGVKSTSKYIYGHYSGQLQRNLHGFINFPKKIHIFDWNGNPVAALESEIPIISFALDTENKRIIAFTGEEDPLRYFNFDEENI